MGVARQSDDTFADKIARWRCFTENAKGTIREIAASMAYLRRTAGEGHTNLSVPEGGDYTRIQDSNETPYFKGVTASPTKTEWTFVIPGDDQGRFIARLRVRHTSELTPIGLPSVDGTNPFFPLLRFNATTQPGGVDENRMFGDAPGSIPAPAGMTITGRIATSSTVTFVGCWPYSIAQIDQTGSNTQRWVVNSALNMFDPVPLLDNNDNPILTNLNEDIIVSEASELGQFSPITIDETLDISVRGGDIFVISYDVPDGEASFTAETDYNIDDDSRFPYFPRYKDAGAFQFDWLSLRPD